MTVQQGIEAKLQQQLAPSYLQVLNESGNHNVPAGSESHFKVVVVSTQFESKMLLARHRMVNEILADELQNNIHALALHTYTESEWQQEGVAPQSPPCQGGSVRDTSIT